MPRLPAVVLLAVVLLVAVPSLLPAQARLQSAILARSAFTSADTQMTSITERAIRMPAASPHRVRNAFVSGAIGAAAGAVACTVISNIADDAAVDRFTTCTAKGYLLTAGIGFGAGFLIGWLGSS